MTTSTMFAVFADFNEPSEDAVSDPAESPSLPLDEIGESREAAWTDGYLKGRQAPDTQNENQPLTAKLLTSLYDLDCKTSEAVEAASLAVADLLVNTVIAATSDNWPARLLDRVRVVADRIKPALTVAPEFVLRDDQGTVRHFADISDLSHALDAGNTGEDVTIRWHRGEAKISRMALLEDLRDAIIPLSAGRENEQPARSQT